MQAINSVILLGRLGTTPELKRTPNGRATCRLRLATNRAIKKGDDWVEETDWHDVVLWEQAAESACRNLAKGALCAVEGRLSARSWQDTEGKHHRVVEVVGRRLTYLPNGTPRPRPSDRPERSDVVLPAPPDPDEESEGLVEDAF